MHPIKITFKNFYEGFMIIKKYLFLLIFCFLTVYAFFHLGSFVNASQPPVKADIIVSLGGDDGKRIDKAIELYEEGYSKSGLFIYTGRDQYIYGKNKSVETFLLSRNIQKNRLIHINLHTSRNTMTELLLIRDFMLKNKYKSVLFISTPMHTRRISILANYIAKYKENGLDYTVTSSYQWRNYSQYLYNEEDRNYVFLEIIKLGYNLIKYSYPVIFFTRYHRRMLNGEWAKDIDNIKPLE